MPLLARWQLQVHATERRDPGPYGTREIPAGHLRFYCISQNHPGFFFHGAAVVCGPHTQPRLHVVIEITDRDAMLVSPGGCSGPNYAMIANQSSRFDALRAPRRRQCAPHSSESTRARRVPRRPLSR